MKVKVYLARFAYEPDVRMVDVPNHEFRRDSYSVTSSRLLDLVLVHGQDRCKATGLRGVALGDIAELSDGRRFQFTETGHLPLSEAAFADLTRPNPSLQFFNKTAPGARIVEAPQPNYPVDHGIVAVTGGDPLTGFAFSGYVRGYRDYFFRAKVHDRGSKFGIECGRVSKLEVRRERELIVRYDRQGLHLLSDARNQDVLTRIIDAFPEPTRQQYLDLKRAQRSHWKTQADRSTRAEPDTDHDRDPSRASRFSSIPRFPVRNGDERDQDRER